jgi:hypothetical protein
MIKNWNQYNEETSWPWQKETELSDDLKPRGIKTEVRPEGGQLRGVSDIRPSAPEKNPLVDDKIDKLFLQEISDRLYGPDSEAYVAAIQELNKKYRKANVLVGTQLSNQESRQREEERIRKEQELIRKFK